MHEGLTRGRVGLLVDGAWELDVARRVRLSAGKVAHGELLRVDKERGRLRAGRGRGERGDAVLDIRACRRVRVVRPDVEDDRHDVEREPETRAQVRRLWNCAQR